MRFLMYEVDNSASANTPPSPALMAEMGKLIEETTKAGILLATGGLGPNSTHVRTSGTKVSVTDGPFTETKELTGGLAFLEGKTKDEATRGGQPLRKGAREGGSAGSDRVW